MLFVGLGDIAFSLVPLILNIDEVNGNSLLIFLGVTCCVLSATANGFIGSSPPLANFGTSKSCSTISSL